MLKYLQRSTFLIAIALTLPYSQGEALAQRLSDSCYMTPSSGRVINLKASCSSEQQNFSKLQEKSLDEDPKIEFARLRIYGKYAHGRITNLSQQNVSIERINVVGGNQTAQIVANLYLKPGQSVTLKEAIIVGGSLDRIADVVSWLDEKSYGHHENFNVCKYASNIESEKMCQYK